jgi:chorismate lyase/3-hydroxybenzoate synthase
MIAALDQTERAELILPFHRSPGTVADPPPHLSPRPPTWVDDALGANARRCDRDATIEAVASGSLLLLRTSVIGAREMPADELRSRVSDTYVAIGGTLSALHRQPIRFWNYLPNPGEPMGNGLDRYMVFNAGRFDGYTKWQGAASCFGPSLATASGVGTLGDDLVVHCLASDIAGTPVENPRQKPAWQYSPRYGPMPPCFSRATIATVTGRRVLLIGGTASIVGEDSRHNDDVAAQLEETLRNLEALIDAASGAAGTGAALSRLIDLRVYVARADDAPAIRSVLEARCTRASRIDLAVARVCRPELLVEVEGVAEI